MHLVLTTDDLSKLKAETREDLFRTLFRPNQLNLRLPRGAERYDWENRVSLKPEQVAEYMEGCAPETIAGLRIIAEEGPIITGDRLQAAGIENYGHFQGRTTKRVRTVTGNKHAYLLAWDDWGSEDNQQYGCGHYAVTTDTFLALRAHFGLDD